MQLVIVECPYRGDIVLNTIYARLCMYDVLRNHNECPILSHLLYTQCLNDNVPDDRQLGIDAGLQWTRVADLHVFYTDLGWSVGMKYAKSFTPIALDRHRERKLFDVELTEHNRHKLILKMARQLCPIALNGFTTNDILQSML